MTDNFDQTRDFLIDMAEANGTPPPSENEIKQIAQRYQSDISKMKSTYGFTDDTMMQLHEEFSMMSGAIIKTIENDPDFRDNVGVYKKYLQTYPYLYFSIIPREVLESRLAAKCVEDNTKLRTMLAEMNTCLGDLVHKISDLQEMSGIPPIARVVFSAIPDPLVAGKGPYQDEVGVYHVMFKFFQRPENSHRFQEFLISPVPTIEKLTKEEVKQMSLEVNDPPALIKMLKGITGGIGCVQEAGDAVNDSMGNPKTEPPVPASRCGEGAVRLGNSGTDGANKTYVAKKGPDGKVVWEMFE